MKITILGTKGEIEESSKTHSKSSGVLVDNILFDIGEQEYLELNPKLILITHIHPDHAFFVKDKKGLAKWNTYIVAPEKAPEGLEEFDYQNWEVKRAPKDVDFANFTIKIIPTIHSKKVKTQGYLIEEHKGKRVLYTGDMIWIKKKFHEQIKNLDLVITDGSFIRKGGMIRRDKKTDEIYGHQGIPNLVNFFSKLGTKHIVFTHFGKWMIKDPKKGKEEIRSFSNNIKVEAAHDGMVINLSDTELNGTTTETIEPMIPKVIVKLKPKAGLYLVKPHAEMIANKEKTLIIKSKKFTSHIDEPLFLLQDSLCFGIVTLAEPVEITQEEFEKLRDKHKITDKEAFERWGWKKEGPLFSYDFSLDEVFDPPIPVKIPKGVQVFVDAKNLKFKNLKESTFLELFNLTEEDLPEDLYAQIMEELYERGLCQSQLFNLIRGWISDYDPSKPNDRQLGDDYRITLGWYSSIKKGKKLFKKVGEEKKEITLQDCKDLSLKIFKEMIKRGFTFNRPETYKTNARELFEWLISQVGKDKIPFKENLDELGRMFGSPTFDDHMLDCFDLWEKHGFTTEYLLKLQKGFKDPDYQGDYRDVLTEQNDYFVMFALKTASEGIKLPHIPLNQNWYMDEAAKMIVDSHLDFYPELKEKNPYMNVEKKAVSISEPSKIEQRDLENIDDVYVKSLTDNQLLALHSRLHVLFKEIGKVTEPLQNAHIFVWNEMRRRKLKHIIEDELDRKTSLEVIEYPTPEEGVPQEISEKEQQEAIKLEEVLKEFPEIILIEDPIHVFLCGRIVNEGKIPSSHDIDILFKQGYFHYPSQKTFLDILAQQNPELAKRFHFVWDVDGPQIGFSVPLYRLSFTRVTPEEMKRSSPFEFLIGPSPQLFKPHIGMKPKSGFKKNEFWDPQEMWDVWAKKYIDKGIIVQKKYDGMRFQIHCSGKEIKMYTEDRQRDRTDVFKQSVEELLSKKTANSFIMDAEMVEYSCGKIESKNLEEICVQVPREEMIKWIGAEKAKLDDSHIVFHIHDCVFLDGKALNDKGYEERWEAIKSIFPDNLIHWRRVQGSKVEDIRAFFRMVGKYRSVKGSEGVVCKSVNSLYKIKYSGEARTDEWAKLKNLKEIDVMVTKVIQKKSSAGKLLDQYLYECAFSIPCRTADKYREKDLIKRKGKCYLGIGRSYATGERVGVGTIITVRPIRIAEFKDPKDKLYYTWMFPYYDGKKVGKTEPDSIDVVKKLVAVGTGPQKLSYPQIFKLSTCPFFEDEKLCPLMRKFVGPRDSLSKQEYLKYPILCVFANHYRCRYVKSYYYGFKETSDMIEVDEDSGEEEHEN